MKPFEETHPSLCKTQDKYIDLNNIPVLIDGSISTVEIRERLNVFFNSIRDDVQKHTIDKQVLMEKILMLKNDKILVLKGWEKYHEGYEDALSDLLNEIELEDE